MKQFIPLEHKIANGIEYLRRNLPEAIRKATPRWVKDKIIDIEWFLFRFKYKKAKTELNKPKKPIIVISIPKNGTNLIKMFLLSIPGMSSRTHFPSGIQSISNLKTTMDSNKKILLKAKPGEVYSWHLPYDKEFSKWLDDHNFKKIFIYRDPRDYAVSLLHFIMNNPPHLPPYPFLDMFSKLNSDDERLMACICGYGENAEKSIITENHLPNIKQIYNQYMGWINDDNTFCLKYEELCYSETSKEQMFKTSSNILHFLGLNPKITSDETLQELLTTGLDHKKSPTFRSGKIGAWKKCFSPNHIEAFHQISGSLLNQLNYKEEETNSKNEYSRT